LPASADRAAELVAAYAATETARNRKVEAAARVGQEFCGIRRLRRNELKSAAGNPPTGRRRAMTGRLHGDASVWLEAHGDVLVMPRAA
jgi:hypothetical protein